MNAEKNKDGEVVKLPKWFCITIITGGISMVSFALTMMSREAVESEEIKRHERVITSHSETLTRHSESIGAIKTDLAVIRTRQEGTDGVLERIEVQQTKILDKLSDND
tara:strand:+ start:223 stop:546 length:324 start_codon:yes stop_codon:yes gene_type:complete